MSENPEKYQSHGMGAYSEANAVVPIAGASVFSSGIMRKVKEHHAVRFHDCAQRIEGGLRGMHITYRPVRCPTILHVTKREFVACADSSQERTRIVNDIYYGQNGQDRICGSLYHMKLECAGIVAVPPSALAAIPCRFMVTLGAPALRIIREQHEEIRRRVYDNATAPEMPIGITLVEAAMSESEFYQRQDMLQKIAAGAEPSLRPFVAKLQGIEYKP